MRDTTGLTPSVTSVVNCLGKLEFQSIHVVFFRFLELQISTTTDEERAYYQACLKVTLHRQVGSRYFVSAVNAAKILFVMKFTEKDISGNKLERDVFDMTPLSWLTLKLIVLCIIMCTEISKSTDLDLSVYL